MVRCVRPSGLEAWEQVYRKDNMAAYGGGENFSSLVFQREKVWVLGFDS